MSGLSTAGNFVTTDTAQDITGEKTIQDKLTLDGEVNAPFAAGQIDLKGDFQNIIQQFTSTFGNQILQGTNTAGAPVMPLGASLIYQSGTSDIIETEGKVVCPTAPAAGNDLTNKTYVDAAIAAGGGGAQFFSIYNNIYGLSNGQNIGFHQANLKASPNVTVTYGGAGSGSSNGTVFSVGADNAGRWLIGFTAGNFFTNSNSVFYIYNKGTILAYLYNTQSFANQYQNLSVIVTTELVAGDIIAVRSASQISGTITGATLSYWGIKLD